MFKSLVMKVLHALRWLVAAFLASSLTVLFLVWMPGRGARDVIDSREFWVAWVRDSGIAEKLRGAVHSAVEGLEEPGLQMLASQSPSASDAVHEALTKVQAQVDRALTRRLGENIDAVVGYLSTRDDVPLGLNLDFGKVLAESAGDVAGAVTSRLCPRLAVQSSSFVADAVARGCDESAVAGAQAAATRLASWFSSSSVASRLQLALLESITGVHQVRVASKAIRVSLHVLALALLACFLLFTLFAWRLRTFATLLGTSLLFAAAALTPFVKVFVGLAPKVLGPEAGRIAASAAGLQHFGIGLHLLLALTGLALLVGRLVAPRYRARFWRERLGNEDSWVSATASRLGSSPAGFLEPVYIGRVLLRTAGK